MQQLCPTLWFQEIDNNFIDKMIFDVYNRLLDDYLEQKQTIPPGNLMELRFEEFEEDPLREMEKIYANLLKEDFAQVGPYFTDYIKSQSGHRKYSYTLDAEDVESVRKNCRKFMNLYNYDLPPDVTLKSKNDSNK